MLLFESSWEVANKVGGIHTVLATKINHAKKYAENYVCLGPYFETSEFTEKSVPEFYLGIFEKLKEKGITCHYGFWNIEGQPEAILFDFKNLWGIKDEVKGLLWNDFQIDSLNSGYEFEEPIIWSWAVGMFLEEVRTKLPKEQIIAHFHEWMAGAALLYLKSNNIDIPSVFTTHATMLGRTLASNHKYHFDSLEKINVLEEANFHGMQDKHLVEKACANNSSVFCTVSEITAKECECFFERRPDVITYNGVDPSLFSSRKGFQDSVRVSKEMLRSFIAKIFFSYYTFDLDKTTFIFTSGRYEFHDKGTDSFIHALARLDRKLEEENSDKTVVAFFLIPAKNYGVKNELKEISFDKVEGEGPPVCTHYIDDESNDAIVSELLSQGLNNSKSKKVKTIFVPIYLDEDDGFFHRNYYDVISGFDLGVFPSSYEPWGYTPLECSALAVPSITSNLAGYGKYMEQFLAKTSDDGIFIIDRDKVDFTQDISEILYLFANKSKQEREHNRISANALSMRCDWKKFYEKYKEAYEITLNK